MKKYFLLMSVLFFISGCYSWWTPRTTKLSQVHTGMSKADLISVMEEEPTGIHFVDGNYVLHYLLYTPDTHMQDYYFTFKNDALVGWDGRHRPRGTSPGAVIISMPMPSRQ